MRDFENLMHPVEGDVSFNKRLTTLVHGNKAKPICTAIRPSSKIGKIDLHRNKAKPEIFQVSCAFNVDRNKAKLKNLNVRFALQ